MPDVNFLVDIKSNDANEFAIRNHHGLGTHIRNSYGLWKRDSEIYAFCKSLGITEPDNISNVVLTELHRYASAQLIGDTYIFAYQKETHKSMNVFALHGHKVKVTSNTMANGNEEDIKLVEEHLNVDYIYTIDTTVVHEFSTDVFLQEREGIKFNSVNFEDVSPQSEEVDQKHPDYEKYNS
mgnify:FL=1